MPNPNIPIQGKYNTYIGARYVPIFADSPWSIDNAYEPLVVVQHQGNSYTSKTFVPAGIDISNTTYWAETGNYNAQVEQYRQDVENLKDTVNGNGADITGLQENVNEIKTDVGTLQTDVGNLQTGLTEANNEISQIKEVNTQQNQKIQENESNIVKNNQNIDIIMGTPSNSELDIIVYTNGNFNFTSEQMLVNNDKLTTNTILEKHRNIVIFQMPSDSFGIYSLIQYNYNQGNTYSKYYVMVCPWEATSTSNGVLNAVKLHTEFMGAGRGLFKYISNAFPYTMGYYTDSMQSNNRYRNLIEQEILMSVRGFPGQVICSYDYDVHFSEFEPTLYWFADISPTSILQGVSLPSELSTFSAVSDSSRGVVEISSIPSNNIVKASASQVCVSYVKTTVGGNVGHYMMEFDVYTSNDATKNLLYGYINVEAKNAQVGGIAAMCRFKYANNIINASMPRISEPTGLKVYRT